MDKSIMGAVICCKSNIRAEGTPKPFPWNPAYGRLHRCARAAALPNPAQPCAGWIPLKLAALDWLHGNKNAAPRGGLERVKALSDFSPSATADG
jgi:hypothetical protein